jgi:TolB protein
MRILSLLTAIALFAPVPAATQAAYEIAVVSRLEGGNGIYVMQADGSNTRLLRTEPNAILFEGSWSPDGKRIAYFANSAADEDLLKKYNVPMHFPIYVMNADGTGRERLLDVPIEPAFEWSPDGSRILFASAFEDPGRDDPRVQRGQVSVATAIYVADVQSRKTTRLTPLGQNRFATWSPDGRRIAFSGDVENSNRDIYVVDVDGSNLRRLATGSATDVQPAWSRGGDWVAYVAAPGGVFVIKPEGSEPRQLSPGSTSDVQWSPDGTQVLIGAAVVDATTGALVHEFTRLGLDPRFSPDGKAILFRTYDSGSATGNIFSTDLQEKNPRRLASGTSFSVGPITKK